MDEKQMLERVIEALLEQQKRLINRIMAMTKPEASRTVAEHEEMMAAQAGTDSPLAGAPAKPMRPRAATADELNAPSGPEPVVLRAPGHGTVEAQA